jgi:hypothetical protein
MWECRDSMPWGRCEQCEHTTCVEVEHVKPQTAEVNAHRVQPLARHAATPCTWSEQAYGP